MRKTRPKDGARGRSAPARDIDAYLADLPKEARDVLEKLRRTTRAAAPKAVAKISYGMPIFFQDGMLVGFAALKRHCSFFPMSMSTMKAFRNELKGCETLKGTVHFAHDRPLPAALVKRIVQSRVRENEERARIRKMNKN